MNIRFPDSLPVSALAEFLNEHGLALAPDGGDNYTAVPRGGRAIPALKPITWRCVKLNPAAWGEPPEAA